MSASLVGSEMCIRDSLALPRVPVLARLSSAVGRSAVHRRPAPRAQLEETCLLYTSDAADDM
eukprot:9618020-Alexandrium_andersonii.AAC.1